MEKSLNFKIKRIEKRLTQMQLRKIAGVSLQTIVNIEKGRPIDGVSLGTLKKLANALDTTVQELFFSDEEEE
ncbi:helix-turn-helix transcriptional regulator [Clostridium thermobutyricum]|uniref:helix-turn-helix transcriptional regulator n=1 Tax=Clostridium thermobutyricum TaxID=29372 RepID=UPI0018A90A54|nr:helix-turn-helix domain-containing protein [Clostridium thermobutyricum]